MRLILLALSFWSLLFIYFPAAASDWPEDAQTISNFWKRDLHLVDKTGEVTADPNATGWIIEPIDGQDAVRLRSDRGTQGYLTLQDGNAVVLPSLPSDNASWWVIEAVPNTPSYRIRTVLDDTLYLNVEQGPLTVSDVHFGAWSGWWLLLPAPEVIEEPAVESASLWPAEPQALQNYWKRDLHLSFENGATAAISDPTGWAIEPVDGQNAVRLRSDRGTRGYLMLDNGHLTTVPAAFNDMASWWVAEPVANTEAYRFRHYIFKNRYLNIEHGPALASDIHFGAWSSWWFLQPAPPDPANANRQSRKIPAANEAAVLDMFGLQETELPILRQAARASLGADSNRTAIAALIDQLATDGPARAEFLPFIVEAGYRALDATSPNAAQTSFRERFRWFFAREQQRKAQGTLVQWLAYTKQSYQGVLSTIPNPTVAVRSLVGPADPEAALALVDGLTHGQELLIVIDTTTPIGDEPTYQPPTLSVLADTGPKLSNFRPNEANPLLLGHEGKTAIELLLTDTVARNQGLMLDLQSLGDPTLTADVERPSELEQVLTRLGFGAGAGVAVVGLSGGPVIWNTIATAKFTITEGAKIAAKQTGEDVAGFVARRIAERLPAQLARTLGPAIARLASGITTMIPALVDVAMAIAEAIETENFDRAIKLTAMGPLKLPDLNLLLRPRHQYDSGLCYDWCAGDGESAFGTECLEACPAPHVDPGAAPSCGPIAKPSYGRGVGTPLICPPGTDANGALCYQQCQAGFTGVGPACWRNCPAGFADDGAICRKNVTIQTKASYNRGAGTPLVCPQGTQQGGALCYPNCRAGFNGVGPVCWGPSAQSYGRGAGVPLSACRPGEERNGALCYPECSSGFVGNGPFCWASCPDGFTDDGLTCRRPEQLIAKATYGRGAGSPVTACPDGKVAQNGACYEPCQAGTSGIGTVCWGTCPEGYADAGGICHIDLIARVSRSRGAGMVPDGVSQCVSIEDRNLNRMTIFAYVAKMMIGDPADQGKLKF
ncbi:RICIN domain-containing protein [Sedimentitalea todarodis]|uniref:Uncharacterized protein n=1 Tax=Sedimentitalea todarodis TaxID=1631240 RepID=A0ABU3VKX9_9RHOB|nr:hypothetical protein [Sedimentitalea todarodis]MDU9006830.1 hypothetical protein [Sedimentitalea todarodis]